ncbi:MAG: SDR family NAD(P)-dependent oxidoreductase [Cyanophyceae cyanobacterium]
MNQFKKTAVLTGSTGGIGQEIARILAQKGWNLGLINRSLSKTNLQLEELRNDYSNQEFTGFTANLMDISELERVAEEVGTKYDQISALYNIAGLLTDKRIMSPQNLEGHFAINTLAPYFLTQRLRKLLSSGTTSDRTAAVINFSSSAANSVKELDVVTLINPEEIGGLMGAYANTKAAIAAASRAIQ